ncbi:MAG: alpha/beta fold hydrolase [Alphaproteobacteria bacterium]
MSNPTKSTTYKIHGASVNLNEERVRFTSTNGEERAGILVHPTGNKRGVAVYAHCFTCGKDIAASRNISRGLAARGITTLRFDFAGIGESHGDFATSGFTNNCEDVLAANAYLQQRNLTTNLLIGHSLGGSAALSAASHTKKISGVVTIGSPAEPAHALRLFESVREEIEWRGQSEIKIGGKVFNINSDFLNDFESQCSKATVSSLNCDLLVMHSPQDNTVNIKNAATLMEWAQHPKSFVSLDNFNHLLSDPNEADYVAEIISSWASRFLGSAGIASPAPAPAEDEAGDHVEVVEGLPLGNLRQEVQVRRHRFALGEPIPIGDDSGPTPYDTLLAGLGSCTAMTLRMYANRKGLPLEQVRVRLTHGRRHADDCERAEGAPVQIEEIHRVVELHGNLSEPERARLLEIADKCPVHRTLSGKLSIRTELAE